MNSPRFNFDDGPCALSGKQREHKEMMARERAQRRVEFAIPNPEYDVPNCVAIYDRLSKVPACKVPLTESEMARVMFAQFTHDYRGVSAAQFIADAIREKLETIRF